MEMLSKWQLTSRMHAQEYTNGADHTAVVCKSRIRNDINLHGSVVPQREGGGTDRQEDRKADRQTGRRTDRETETDRNRQAETERDRQRKKETDRNRQAETQRDRQRQTQRDYGGRERGGNGGGGGGGGDREEFSVKLGDPCRWYSGDLKKYQTKKICLTCTKGLLYLLRSCSYLLSCPYAFTWIFLLLKFE